MGSKNKKTFLLSQIAFESEMVKINALDTDNGNFYVSRVKCFQHIVQRTLAISV